MNLIILGAPGSGKGTQASRIAEKWKLNHVSTGELLRDAVARQTPLGKQVASTLASGQLVPDSIVLQLIKEAIDDHEGRWQGWILDGYPRTTAQAEALEGVLVETGDDIDGVIVLEVDPEVIVQRLSNRRTCSACKTVYNLINNPPRDDEKCDYCGSELMRREDDEPATIRKRLEVYRKQTLPIIRFYEGKRRVYRVDGSKSIDEVTERIEQLMDR